jgi:hypothetical protein
MKRRRLICGYCDQPCGWATEARLSFRSHSDEPRPLFGRGSGPARVWKDIQIDLDPADPDRWPVLWACHQCGAGLILSPPPWPGRGHRLVVPATVTPPETMP